MLFRSEITDEKEVIRVTAYVFHAVRRVVCSDGRSNEKRCIIHFFHTDFKRCQIMDKHLAVRA